MLWVGSVSTSMGYPSLRTVVNTSIAIPSGEGRDSVGSLQLARSGTHSAHISHESMKTRDTLGYPARKTSRSNLTSLRLVRALHVFRSDLSGAAFWKGL